MKRLKRLISEENPALIVSVGDVVSENMTKHGIAMDVAIVDNRVMRRSRRPVALEADKTIYVRNSPGTITEEAWLAVKKVMEQKQLVKIVVDGEEDLLALIALFHAPLNAFIIYGQPYQGIVVIKATKQKKQKARRILEAMQRAAKN